ncbi:ABC transporter E family member 2 [Diplonema papillatum]|nr:ABC transporter E family member 2 [Diplonema papillatum]
MSSRKQKGDDRQARVAIVAEDKCKPRRCKQECKKFCPVVRGGGLCIEVTPTSKHAWISEELCIGCNLCTKKCPFQAIQIINLPKNLESFTTHRYGPNSFKLHRLPQPRPGQVLGLVGTNGIGKSTALKVLSGQIKPNLGNFKQPPEWADILKYFRGSELQAYFQKILEDTLKTETKIQYVDQIPRSVSGKVDETLKKRDDRDVFQLYVDELELGNVLKRDLKELSGGELQRFAIASTCVREADMYMFDEPSSYLDVKQRLTAARLIRELVNADRYIIVVEHDLSICDYLSDFVCILYGKPGAYGVVTMPFGVREGINIFLDGFIPTENMRFREYGLSFKIADAEDDALVQSNARYSYPSMTRTQGDFKLHIDEGEFTDSEIVVLLGENGTGKTTFIKMIAGVSKPDETDLSLPEFNISFKPQTIAPKFKGPVRSLLQAKINDSYMHPQFQTDVFKPLKVDEIIDQDVQVLSGGELQRVALILALGKAADIFLIDEPSAYLDSEQRLIAAKVIKRFILHAKKSAFIVEHDFIMATYLADKVIVYDGQPAVECYAREPTTLLVGMNKFLTHLNITFRRDPDNFRPRINKPFSVKDREQKAAGNYFFMAEEMPVTAAKKGKKEKMSDDMKPKAKESKPKEGDDTEGSADEE